MYISLYMQKISTFRLLHTQRPPAIKAKVSYSHAYFTRIMPGNTYYKCQKPPDEDFSPQSSGFPCTDLLLLYSSDFTEKDTLTIKGAKSCAQRSGTVPTELIRRNL